MNTIYLDYAAATPLDSAVLAAMQPYFSNQFYNPSGLSLHSRSVADALQVARQDIARLIGATSSEILFTAGGSEANNHALQGVLKQFPGKKVAISAIEHDSVSRCAEQFPHLVIPVDAYGRIVDSAIRSLLDDDVVVVSCIYASNEIGTVQQLTKIVDAVKAIREDRRHRGVQLPLFLHVDACQAFYLDLQVARLGIDLMTCNGGKMYGPKQSGFLYVRTGTPLTPLIYGGGQEQGLRSGTENVSACIGLSAAFVAIRQRAKQESERLKTLRDTLQAGCMNIDKDVRVHGHPKYRLPHHLSIAFPGVDNERLLMLLDEKGVIAAAGSACHAARGVPSSVLRAIGVSEIDAQSTIRFSLGSMTTSTDTHRTIEILSRALPETRRLS